MSYGYSGKQAAQGKDAGAQGAPGADIDLAAVRLGQSPTPDLFSEVAKRVAEKLAEAEKSNKPTQLRRFYDEICMWEQKARRLPDDAAFADLLPFIRMLNAKVAYASGRKVQGARLVDPNFVKLVEHGLRQVDSRATFYRFKTFMEAVMGFYKAARPDDKN